MIPHSRFPIDLTNPFGYLHFLQHSLAFSIIYESSQFLIQQIQKEKELLKHHGFCPDCED